jgi:hypothetical protein
MKKSLLALTLIAVGHFASGDFVSNAQAGTIPYPLPGTPNPITYTFTAAGTGDVTAYFFGFGGASYTDSIGMIDDTSMTTNPSGLPNQPPTAVGDSFNLGHATAGDVLTFYLNVVTNGINSLPNYTVYSNPALNPAVPGSSVPYLNEVYATAFSASSPFPAGVYLGFEDGTGSDYVAEQVVLTNVDFTVTPLPAALPLFAGGLGLMGLLAKRRKCKKVAALPAA